MMMFSRYERAMSARCIRGMEREANEALLESATLDEDLRAQFELGCALANGDTMLVRDAKASFTWYEKAAMAGHAPSMAHLSYCLRRGSGTT
jgi:TPR repeat protein